jgi:hypothetical protein
MEAELLSSRHVDRRYDYFAFHKWGQSIIRLENYQETG